MKKSYLLIILLFIGITNNQAQGWEWMKPVGFNYSEFSTTELTKSPSGNLLIRALSAYGAPAKTDLFLCNARGEMLWRKSFPGVTIEDVCFDPAENVYFSGSFKEKITLQGIAITSTGSSDALAVKLNSSGNYVTHKSFGSPTAETAFSLAVHNNNIFVTGFFRGAFTINGHNFNAWGDKRAFLIKFNSTFGVLKTFQTDSSGTASGIKINVNTEGDVYLLSSGNELVGFGDDVLEIWDSGQFLAKFTNDLSPVWGKVVISQYMQGYYYPYINFDNSGNLAMLMKSGGGGGASHHLRLFRYDASGNVLSEKTVPENFNGYMDLDAEGTAWVAGRDMPFAQPSYFSISSTTTANVTDSLFYDETITGDVINGFALNNKNDFYILAKCQNGNRFGSNSCSSEGEAFLIHYNGNISTEAPELAANEELNIYPNPSSGVFTVELTGEDPQNIRAICVYDLLGKCILTQPYNNNSLQQVDLSAERKGIYFVVVETFETSPANVKGRSNKLNRKIVLN